LVLLGCRYGKAARRYLPPPGRRLLLCAGAQNRLGKPRGFRLRPPIPRL